MYCIDGVNPLNNLSISISTYVEQRQCAPYTLASFPLMNRCFPVAIKDVADQIGSGLLNITNADGIPVAPSDILQASFDFQNALYSLLPAIIDLYASKWIILVGLSMALVFSKMWIILLRFFVGVIVWLLLIIIIIGFAALFVVCAYRYLSILGYSVNIGNYGVNFVLTNSTSSEIEVTFGSDLIDYFYRNSLQYVINARETWLVLGIIFGILFLFSLICVIFLGKRISLAIALLKESSKAIGAMWSTLAWPLIPFILLIISLTIFVGISIFIATIQTSDIPGQRNMSWVNETVGVIELCGGNEWYSKLTSLNGTAHFSSCLLNNTIGEPWVTIIQAYNIFMGLWILNFIYGFGQTVLAGAFSTYYWASGNVSKLPTLPLLRSIFRTIFFHLGSIALGSFLIALVQFIRLILMYLYDKLKLQNNSLVKFLFKCLQCLFYLLEKFLKFISKNAYILIASWGVNFWTGAKNSFQLIFNNVIRVTVVNKVTDLVIFLGEIFVTSIIVAGTYFYLSGLLPIPGEFGPKLNTFYLPLIILTIGAFAISVYCFSVFHMAIDTLFLCAMEDLHNNREGKREELKMSPELKNALGVKE